MKSSIRLVGVTLLAGGLSLGGTVLSAGMAAADTGLKATTTMSGDHNFKDDTCTSRHDSSHGSWDSKGRFHDRSDSSGWRDDNCNLRSDDDYNGRWHDGNGCEHDQWGWWSHDGKYNWDNNRDDHSNSKSHDDKKSDEHKADNHKSDNKNEHKADNKNEHKSDNKPHKS